MSVHDVSKVPTIFFSRNTLDSINFYLSKKKKKKKVLSNNKYKAFLIFNKKCSVFISTVLYTDINLSL